MNTKSLASELTPSDAAFGFEHRWIENEANRFGIDDDQPQIIGVIACVVSDSRLILKMNGPTGDVYEIVQYGTSHFGPEPMPTWHRVTGQSADPSEALLNALAHDVNDCTPMPAPRVLRIKNHLTILYEREQGTKAEIVKHGGRLVRFGQRRMVAFRVNV